MQVMYQDEPLVQLLVSCQAHNYLEFKLVEGKCVLPLLAWVLCASPLLPAASQVTTMQLHLLPQTHRQ